MGIGLSLEWIVPCNNCEALAALLQLRNDVTPFSSDCMQCMGLLGGFSLFEIDSRDRGFCKDNKVVI